MGSLPLVSISCITYNHEDYISQAIEGFLMQKTSFDFEILIHDDASTDKTSEIVLTYAQKYPDIVKPIIQKENQWQQGRRQMSILFNYPRAKGKFIALCEGDDYWTDPRKLQDQVDFMQSNSDYIMSCHAGEIVYTNASGKYNEVYSLGEKFHEKGLPSGLVVRKGGSFILTPSIMFNAELVSKFPPWVLDAPVGDFPLVLVALANGEIGYLDHAYCAYRRGSVGSWTERKIPFKAYENFYQSTGKYLAEFSKLTQGRFESDLRELSRKRAYMLVKRFMLEDYSNLQRLYFLLKNLNNLSFMQALRALVLLVRVKGVK